MQRIATGKAPYAAIALHSQAVVFNNVVYTSGQLGIDPATGKLLEGTIQHRVRQALKNVQAVLEAAGSSMKKVLRVTIWVTNAADIPLMNEEYIKHFQDPKPVRACVVVKELALGTDIELEATAWI
ncbi:unnamed protein product [Clonostachys solani]|uniref:Uncharacterized protein n=1 Tax=Clonostachys solani TaxID=160281 RepID=A0A9P0EGF3_9HYPO|nr:unnamed protein product [Clonostachys solani]